MNQPLFSIITPTCDRPVFLKRAVRSVIGQTFGNFEHIIVDDGRSPCSLPEPDLPEDDRRIIIRHPFNRGQAAAYNTGMRAARGAYICFLDDDDECDPSFLEKTREFFESASPRIGFIWTGIRRVIDTATGSRMWFEKTWPPACATEEDAYLHATTIGNGFGLSMRRKCLGAVGMYDETFPVCEDTEYLFRLARQYRFATIPEVLVTIHGHEQGQLTHAAQDAVRLKCYERVLNRNADLMKRYPRLARVHYRRLADLHYRVGSKTRGRRILMRLWRSRPGDASLLLDLVSLEAATKDARTWWNGSPLKRTARRIFKGPHKDGHA